MANTNDAELKAVQDEYERETGERPSLAIAGILLDRQREADSYRDEYTVEEAVEDFKAKEGAWRSYLITRTKLGLWTGSMWIVGIP